MLLAEIDQFNFNAKEKIEIIINKRNNTNFENQVDSVGSLSKRKSLKNFLWLYAFFVCLLYVVVIFNQYSKQFFVLFKSILY